MVINGGPTAGNLSNLHQFDVVFSHSIGQDATDLAAYKLVTANAARAGTVAEVPAVVDAAISTAITTETPGLYRDQHGHLEFGLPDAGRAAAASPIRRPARSSSSPPTIVGLIRAAQSPLILVGTEIQRYGLADKVADLIAKLGVRWATALLAKSTLAEQGAGWIGVYDPPHSQPAVKTRSSTPTCW